MRECKVTLCSRNLVTNDAGVSTFFSSCTFSHSCIVVPGITPQLSRSSGWPTELSRWRAASQHLVQSLRCRAEECCTQAPSARLKTAACRSLASAQADAAVAAAGPNTSSVGRVICGAGRHDERARQI